MNPPTFDNLLKTRSGRDLLGKSALRYPLVIQVVSLIERTVQKPLMLECLSAVTNIQCDLVIHRILNCLVKFLVHIHSDVYHQEHFQAFLFRGKM